METDDIISNFKGDGKESSKATGQSEGRVKYADAEMTENAVKEFNATCVGGKGGKGGVGGPNVLCGHDGEDGEPGPGGKGGAGGRPAVTNNLSKRPYSRGLDNYENNKCRWNGGGKGGKGGMGSLNISSGHDGEDGEPGPGGKGGAGGRPAVTNNLGKRPYSRGIDNDDNNKYKWPCGGRGGKGGTGSSNIPNGHNGEDGEPGPGGKGGAGGKPAMSRPTKNSYTRNWDSSRSSSFTRIFGRFRRNKNNDNCSRNGVSTFWSFFSPQAGGGGKGGKSEIGGPIGQKAENSESGPGGKCGAGGRPIF